MRVRRPRRSPQSPHRLQVLGQGGDVEAAFAAGKTVEAMYTYHYVSHSDLEPQNTTAWFKGDSIEIWSPTQTPQAAVDAVAALVELAEGQGHVASAAGRRRIRPAAGERQRMRGRRRVEAGGRHPRQSAVDARRRHGLRLLPAGRLPLVQSGRRQERQAVRLAGPLHHVQPRRQGADDARRTSRRPSSRPTCSRAGGCCSR